MPNNQTAKAERIIAVCLDAEPSEWSDKKYELEIGKAYLWNTKKPHRPTVIKKVTTKQPRINVVLGLTPWLDLNHNTCEYTRNNLFGKPVNEIVKEKLFVK